MAQRQAEGVLTRRQVDEIRASLVKTAMACFTTDLGQPVVPAKHHELIAFALERDYLGHTLVVAPPGHAKTWWVGDFYTAWKIGQSPGINIIYLSNTAAHALKQSVSVRDTIAYNPAYHALFPQVRAAKEKGWGEIEWFVQRPSKNDPNATFYAAGLFGGIIGSRARLMIWDDINDEEQQLSEIQREKSRGWCATTAMSRVVTGGRCINIQTRWHELDQAAWCIDQGWTYLHFKAWSEDERQTATFTVWREDLKNAVAADLTAEGWSWEIDEAGDEERGNRRWIFTILLHTNGPALWPEFVPVSQLLEKKRQNGPQKWAAMFQGMPVPAGGAVFPMDALQSYDWNDGRQRHQPWVMKIQSWDTAFSTKTSADYSVCTTWGMAQDRTYWLLDVYRKRVPFPDLKKAMTAQFDIHRPSLVLVEDMGSGKSAVQEMQRALDPNLGRLPIVPIKPDRDKVARANAVTGYVEAKRVYIPANAPWIDDYLNELSLFPNGAHDDQVDSTVMALHRLINTGGHSMNEDDYFGTETFLGNIRAREF